MELRRLAFCTIATATLLVASFTNNTTYAQSASPAEATSAPSKAEAKAARKAARKEARAKKNAELSTLQKNGYNAQSPEQDYPQNLQRAEQKSRGTTAASAAAKTVPPPGSGQ